MICDGHNNVQHEFVTMEYDVYDVMAVLDGVLDVLFHSFENRHHVPRRASEA